MDKDLIEESIDDVEEFIWDIVSKYNVDKYKSIDMEDLFQEGWIALKNTGKPDTASFSTYAYSVIDNRIKNILDKHSRSSSREFSYAPYGGDEEEPVPLVEKIPDNSGLTVEQESRLDTAMSSLDVKDKEMIRLDSEGFTQQEIAEQLGISQQTVSNHLRGSREKIGSNY